MRCESVLRRGLAALLISAPLTAFAQTPTTLDSSDAAWMLTATMLVLLMVMLLLPGQITYC